MKKQNQRSGMRLIKLKPWEEEGRWKFACAEEVDHYFRRTLWEAAPSANDSGSGRFRFPSAAGKMGPTDPDTGDLLLFQYEAHVMYFATAASSRRENPDGSYHIEIAPGSVIRIKTPIHYKELERRLHREAGLPSTYSLEGQAWNKFCLGINIDATKEILSKGGVEQIAGHSQQE